MTTIITCRPRYGGSLLRLSFFCILSRFFGVVDVSYDMPPFKAVLHSPPPQQFSPVFRQVVPDVMQPPPVRSSSPSFPRHHHHSPANTILLLFSIHAHATSTYFLGYFSHLRCPANSITPTNGSPTSPILSCSLALHNSMPVSLHVVCSTLVRLPSTILPSVVSFPVLDDGRNKKVGRFSFFKLPMLGPAYLLKSKPINFRIKFDCGERTRSRLPFTLPRLNERYCHDVTRTKWRYKH